VKIVGAKTDHTPLSVQELIIDVREKDVLPIMQLGDDLVGFFVLDAIGIARIGAAWEDRQKHYLDIREILTQLQDDGADAFGNLRCCS
jgi:hypothetical protein